MTAKRKYTSPTVRSLMADTESGCCVFCGDELPAESRADRIMCGTVECLTSYDRVTKSDRRAAQRQERNEQDMSEAFTCIRMAFSHLLRIRSRLVAVEAVREG